MKRPKTAPAKNGPLIPRWVNASPIMSGPSVCPRRSTMPLMDINVALYSTGACPASNVWMQGMFTPCPTPNIAIGINMNHMPGINGINNTAKPYRRKAYLNITRSSNLSVIFPIWEEITRDGMSTLFLP